jgi:hypothetical protein
MIRRPLLPADQHVTQGNQVHAMKARSKKEVCRVDHDFVSPPFFRLRSNSMLGIECECNLF